MGIGLGGLSFCFLALSRSRFFQLILFSGYHFFVFFTPPRCMIVPCLFNVDHLDFNVILVFLGHVDAQHTVL